MSCSIFLRFATRSFPINVLALLGLNLLAAPYLRAGHTAPEAKSDGPLSARRAPLERMSYERLKATHADVVRLAAQRRRLEPLPGLYDFRCILHAHAEDSAHTGGTRPEMLADAKRASVHAILLTDHFRPPRDFISDSWRGVYEDVLFIPGSESRGFLIYPSGTILDKMDQPLPEFIATVRRDRGLIFLSHIEERPQHSTEGLDGMEIYNRHADAKKDVAGIIGLMLKLTDPQALRELEQALQDFPDELLASQISYPEDYLAKWDAETPLRRLTGVAANDCHHNQILIMKMIDEATVAIGTNVDSDEKLRRFTATLRPGIRQLTKDRQPGDILARLDLDPYFRAFRNVSTHVLAGELSEANVRRALRDGRAYVSHDWMCDPTGFRFHARLSDRGAGVLGDDVSWTEGLSLVAELPVTCRMRLLRNGQVVHESVGERLEYGVPEPGVYRIEAWLRLDDEDRPWIYANPIYVRAE